MMQGLPKEGVKMSVVERRIDSTQEVEVVARREKNIDVVNPNEERNDQSQEGDHTLPLRRPPHRCLLRKWKRRNVENQSIPSMRRRESIDIVILDAVMKVTVTAMMQQRKYQQCRTRVKSII